MIKTKCPFLSVLFLLLCAQTFAQEIRGKVLAERGYGASDVTVSFTNKSNAVITNADGSFKIFATKLPDTLIFTAPGFEAYKVIVTEKNVKDPNFEVVLLNKRENLKYTSAEYSKIMPTTSASSPIISEDLSEVVVRGYATKKSLRKDVSGKPRKEGEYSVNGKVRNEYYSLDTTDVSRDPALAKSQILTAGEVNDFYKWKMWEDLTANEFQLYSKYWNIYPKKRYCVQLQNKDHLPVVDEAVHLIDKNTGDTIWSAITDNTGKTELWANIYNASDIEKQYIIRSAGGSEIKNPVLFSKGINHINTKADCGASDIVDIAFVVDATGSMGDEINFLKMELEDVIRKTYDKYHDLNVRVGSVFYRDKGDEYVTKHIDFQTDLLKVLNFVKLQRDGGGGDTPEAVDSALDVALNKLSWSKQARARLLFLVLDAPPHDYAAKDIQKLITKAAAMGVRIIPIACSGSDKQNEFLLRSMALATNGSYTFLTDHSGIGNKHTEASTDKYELELLNSLMQRLIQQFIYVKACTNDQVQTPLTHQPVNSAMIKLYPNPTSGNFTIETNKDIKEIYIADFAGKILMKLGNENKRGTWKVNISKYPSGTYFVRYITKDNKLGAEKVVLIR